MCYCALNLCWYNRQVSKERINLYKIPAGAVWPDPFLQSAGMEFSESRKLGAIVHHVPLAHAHVRNDILRLALLQIGSASSRYFDHTVIV